jgi:hypothetical protein
VFGDSLSRQFDEVVRVRLDDKSLDQHLSNPVRRVGACETVAENYND